MAKKPAVLRKKSSIDNEYELVLDSHHITPREKRQSDSIMFHLVQYPILFMVFLAMAFDLFCYSCARIYVRFAELFFEFFSKQYKLKRDLAKAKNYEEWIKIAKKLDTALDLEKWKSEPSKEPLFDEHLLVKITNRLKANMESGDIVKLCSTLRSSACKNDLAGVEHPLLYSKCFAGTKSTIDDYVNTVQASLDFVDQSNELDLAQKSKFFKLVSVLYGRTSLCLSGGATLGYFHLGVLKALWEKNMLPEIFSGTSSGSMMAAMICVRTDEELAEEIFHPLMANKIKACNATFMQRFHNFVNTGAIFSAEHFREAAQYFTKNNMTFLEAYERTGRVLNITVMSHQSHSKLKVLNYINTPQVTIASATVASSAVPGILPPCELFMKDENGVVKPYYHSGKLWRDGSMKGDIPEKELHQLYRVKYTIVSQVNPHISLFFFNPKGSPGSPPFHRSGKGWRGGFLASCIVRYFLLDMEKWLAFLRDLDLLPFIMDGNFSNLWLQIFWGNCTITSPRPTIKDLYNILNDPTPDVLERNLNDGQISTWPKFHMISNRLRIENKILNYLCKYQQDDL